MNNGKDWSKNKVVSMAMEGEEIDGCWAREMDPDERERILAWDEMAR